MNSHAFEKMYSLSELAPLLTKPKETLLVFDVDYTLTQPNEPAFQFVNFVKNKELIQGVFDSLSHGERDIFSNLMVFHLCGNSTIEEESPSIIRELQEMGIKTIALTASMTAPLKRQCLIQKRLKNLKELGFDFSQTFKNIKPQYFDSLDSNYKSHPYFEKGVLFSNGENPKNYKGEVLLKFLSLIKWKPKQIVLVDDRLQNHQAVHQALADTHPEISFLGIHFLGALKFPSREVAKEDFKLIVESLAIEAKELNKTFNDEINMRDPG